MSTNRNLFLPVVLISPVLGALFPNKILFVYSEFEYNHFGKFLITNRYFAHAQFITGYHWSFRNIAGILYMVEKDCFSGLEVIKLCSCSNQPSMKELCALRGYFAPPSPPPLTRLCEAKHQKLFLPISSYWFVRTIAQVCKFVFYG